MRTLLITISTLLLLFALGCFLVYWFFLKPDYTTETLLETNFRGLQIRFQRDFYKAKIGSNSESVILYLDGKKAARTGTVWQGWGNPDARPLPVHKEDMAFIVKRQSFFVDSLYDDEKYRNLWIRPQQFSRNEFDKLAAFIGQFQGDSQSPFQPLASHFPYWIANLVYGDPDPMKTRQFTREHAKEDSDNVQIRMDGQVEYWQWPYMAPIGQVLPGGETLLFHWNRDRSWAGSDTGQLTIPDLVHFRDEQGKALSERYQICLP